ncbi:hypothetical protein [Corynebacterium auriscanis]
MSDWQGSGFNQPTGSGNPTRNSGGFSGGFGGPTGTGAGYGDSGFAGSNNNTFGSRDDYSQSGFDSTSQGFGGRSFSQSASGQGGQVGQGGNLAFTSAPHLMLLPSLVSSVISITLSLILFLGGLTVSNGMYFPLAFGAWALAGIIGVVGLGPYFSADNARRTAGIYQIVGWKQGLYWATIFAVLVGVVLSAIHLGIWVGKS